MSLGFLNPAYLYALTLLALPIIIHLFRQKKYKIEYFSDTSLLKEVAIKHKKKRKIDNILILILRLLCITALVLAFAKPYFSSQDSSIYKSQYYSIYIDNSYSMSLPSASDFASEPTQSASQSRKQASDPSPAYGSAQDLSRPAATTATTLFEEAKKKAKEILSNIPIDARVQILSNDFLGEMQAFYSTIEAEKLLEEIEISPSSRTLEEVYLRSQELCLQSHIESTKLKRIYISDFQSSTLGSFVDSLGVYVPLEADFECDYFIDSIVLINRGLLGSQNGEIEVFINASKKDTAYKISRDTLKINLRVDGKQQAILRLGLKDGLLNMGKIPFFLETPGRHSIEVSIDDEIMAENNSKEFEIEHLEYVNIAHIYKGSPLAEIEKLYSLDTVFNYRNFEYRNIDYKYLDSASLIILENVENLALALRAKLEERVNLGSSLCLIPPFGRVCNIFLGDRIGGKYIAKSNAKDNVLQYALSRNARHGKLEDVEIEKYRYALPSGALEKNRLWNNFLHSYEFGSGRVYAFSCPLDTSHTNFTKSYTFVLAMVSMLERNSISSLKNSFWHKQNLEWDYSSNISRLPNRYFVQGSVLTQILYPRFLWKILLIFALGFALCEAFVLIKRY